MTQILFQIQIQIQIQNSDSDHGDDISIFPTPAKLANKHLQ